MSRLFRIIHGLTLVFVCYITRAADVSIKEEAASSIIRQKRSSFLSIQILYQV